MRWILKKYRFFLSIFVIYIIVNMVIFPKLYINQTLSGLSAWAMNVLPSVLPFMFFTKVLSNLGTVERFSGFFARPMQKFFNAPALSSYVFLMSIISGYPVGAKMTADLYESNKISRSEAFRMTSFCSTSGPMFIIGAVGAGMLCSAKFGYIIFLAHALGAFINGFLYRKVKAEELPVTEKQNNNTKQDLNGMIVDSAISIIAVGVIIAIFFVVITSLSPILNLLPAPLASIFAGLIEITKGCMDISTCMPSAFAIIASTFIISFGGISTILQSFTMLNRLKMPIWLFVLQKFTHAILATLIAVILVLICGF